MTDSCPGRPLWESLFFGGGETNEQVSKSENKGGRVDKRKEGGAIKGQGGVDRRKGPFFLGQGKKGKNGQRKEGPKGAMTRAQAPRGPVCITVGGFFLLLVPAVSVLVQISRVVAGAGGWRLAGLLVSSVQGRGQEPKQGVTR